MRETAWADKLKPQLGNCVVNNFAPTRFPQDPQLIYFIKENDDWYQHLKSTSSHCWCLFEAKKIDSLQHLGKWMLNSLLTFAAKYSKHLYWTFLSYFIFSFVWTLQNKLYVFQTCRDDIDLDYDLVFGRVLCTERVTFSSWKPPNLTNLWFKR